jgi:hypothetical protein
MNGPPIIRIELESMREAITTMFSERQLGMDEYVQAELDRFCQPENLQALVGRQVEINLKAALKQAIENFFQWGDGAKVVKSATNAALMSALAEMQKAGPPADE